MPASRWGDLLRVWPCEECIELARELCGRSITLAQKNGSLARRAALAALASSRRARLSMAVPSFNSLAAEAWACLANAWRVQGPLDRAEAAWPRAERAARRSEAGQPLVAELKATLRRAQRRFPEAEALFRSAVSLYEELSERHLQGRTHLSLAILHSTLGENSVAFREVVEALRHIDRSQDNALYHLALHEQALILADLGQTEQAYFWVKRLEPYYYIYGGELLRLRGQWLKGRLHTKRRDFAEAEHYLEAVRAGFLARDMHYDAALVALDLALVYTEQRKSLPVARLAREMYPVFVSERIPREASFTLLLFHQAAMEVRVDTALLVGWMGELDAQRRQA